jgi:hypothetical protein
MRFLVQVEVFETITGAEADRRLREVVGPQVEQVMRSGNVREAGFLADRRGAFFLLDVDAAEELYALFGPEVYGNFRVQATPVAPLEAMGTLFQEWAREGR